MRINPDYMLKTIGDDHVVVPTGKEAIRFKGVITLNESGARLFNALSKRSLEKKDLIQLLEEAYDVDTSTASKDVERFLETLRAHNVLVEDE